MSEMTKPEGFNYLPAEWRAYIVSLESARSEGFREGVEAAAKVCDELGNSYADDERKYALGAWAAAGAIRALQHAPARVAEGDEYGWLIERFVNEHHEWFAGWNDDSHGFIPKSPKWTRDAFQAIRFSRKQDGEALATYDGNFMGTKVIEHGFMPPESPAKEQLCRLPKGCEAPEMCEELNRCTAKEQPGEIAYWKECYGCSSPTRCMKENTCYIQKYHAAPQAQAKGFAHEQSENGFESRKPAVAAPDAAAMVKRLKDGARHLRLLAGYNGEPLSTITFELSKELDEAAAMLEKLRQGWIPVSKPFERYPSSAELVLVATEHPDESIRLGYHLSGQWRIMSHDSKAFLVDIEYPITHWMPLPPPPERP